MQNGEIDLYIDALVMETLLSNKDLSKTAQSGMVGNLISSVKGYFDNHIDPDDKSGSILNLLAPGAISLLFSSMGLPWFGRLLGLAASVFHIDVKGILTTVYEKIKTYVTQDQKLSSTQIQSIVDGAVEQNAEPMNESDLDQVAPNRVTSMDKRLKDAMWLKLALMAYDKDVNSANWIKTSSRRSNVISILSRVLGFIFKIGLASAGFMVAGDVVNKFLGRPNALDNTIMKGKSVEAPAQVEAPLSTQTKFKVRPGYVDTKYNISNNWIERIPNTQSGIEGMVMGFVKEVYDGLDNLDSQIRSSNAFNKVVNDIAWYNHSSAGDQVVFLPKTFTSKKQLVDHFIDEVASKAS